MCASVDFYCKAHLHAEKSTLDRSVMNSYARPPLFFDTNWAVDNTGNTEMNPGTLIVGRIEEGWAYAMLMGRQHGRWVVSQLHVFPESPNWESRCATRMESGGWRDWQDSSIPVAPGGLAARHLRRIPFGQTFRLDVRTGAGVMRGLEKAAAELARNYRRPRSGPIGLGKGARRLALIARLYVEALGQRSRRPNADVALKLKLRSSAVRDAIHRARKHGLLSTTDREGRSGGELTAQALDLLAELDRARERNRPATASASQPPASAVPARVDLQSRSARPPKTGHLRKRR